MKLWFVSFWLDLIFKVDTLTPKLNILSAEMEFFLLYWDILPF